MKNLKIDPTTKFEQNYSMQGEFFMNKRNLNGKKLACQKGNHQDSQEFLLVGGTPMVGSQHATMTIEDEKEFLKLKIVNCINFYVKDFNLSSHC
jgi:hypothetical protein